jgi:hypothetical protein
MAGTFNPVSTSEFGARQAATVGFVSNSLTTVAASE